MTFFHNSDFFPAILRKKDHPSIHECCGGNRLLYHHVVTNLFDIVWNWFGMKIMTIFMLGCTIAHFWDSHFCSVTQKWNRKNWNSHLKGQIICQMLKYAHKTYSFQVEKKKYFIFFQLLSLFEACCPQLDSSVILDVVFPPFLFFCPLSLFLR